MFRFFTIALLIGSLITNVSANTNLGVEQSVINAQQQKQRQQEQFLKEQGYFAEGLSLPDLTDVTWANESPCFNINDVKLMVANDDEGLLAHHFNFVLKPLLISNTPTYAMGHCIGTQNLATLIHIAQNELLKKGYLTSQVTANNQQLSTGVLILEILPGRIDKLTHNNQINCKKPKRYLHFV